jgi:hypothetical protein
MSIEPMVRHAHSFVEKYTGMLCFGASRQQDVDTLICCLQKFSDDQVMEALVPRLSEDDRERIFNMLTEILKEYFSEDEYHRLFLKDTPVLSK